MPSQQHAVMQDNVALGFDKLLINKIINSSREGASCFLPMESQ